MRTRVMNYMSILGLGKVGSNGIRGFLLLKGKEID